MASETKQCSITTAANTDTLIVRTDGYLDDKGGEALSEIINNSFDKNYKNYVLNFEKSPVINSQGISHLLEICEIVLDDHDCNVSFVGLNELTRGVFRMVGLLEMADCFESESEAVESFS